MMSIDNEALNRKKKLVSKAINYFIVQGCKSLQPWHGSHPQRSR